MTQVTNLQVNYLRNLAVVAESPQFSWAIESEFRNCRQTQYQLQIAFNADFSEMLIDTGFVNESTSAHVVLPDFVPAQGCVYYARVRVVTQADVQGSATSGFSSSVKMLAALKNPQELKSHFITAEGPQDIKKAKGTYLRRELNLQGPVKRALVHCTAQGLYQLHLNGGKVSDQQLAPGWTSYDRRLLYQTHDVTDRLLQGENVIAAHLGAGWYKGDFSFLHIKNFYGNYASLSLRLDVQYTDGRTENFFSDDSWKGCPSPVRYAEIYNGEEYDAALEQPGWDAPNFDDAAWQAATPCPCTAELIEAQVGSPVVLNEELRPKLAFYTPKGERVIDFGQNMSALPEITGQGKAGDIIELSCFEVLDKDGNVYINNLREARQKIVYTLKDDKPFRYRPHFTFYGFRFIHVKSFCGRSDLDNFSARAIYSDMGETGNFACSNPDLNQLQHNIQWGLKSNFVDVPTDCPQRDERMGWTGDAQIFCQTATFNMNTYTFFSKWLKDVALDQKAAGGVPHVVPDMLNKYPFDNWLLNEGTHSAAAWADAAIINPWVLYQMYGDRVILENQYESMKALIDFMASHSKDNIWNYKLQFGDWVALDAEEGSYFGATPNDITCTAYYAYSTELFVKICRILGKPEVAREYESLKDSIVNTFRNSFFNDDGSMSAQTQTAHILALHFDLVPPQHRLKTVQALKRLLDAENGHLVTGFVGTPYFCHALSSNGCLNEAYDLLLKDDFPSWLYQVKKGATTIWEHWDGVKPDGSMWSADMNSFNHYAYGAIGEWLYKVVGGIQPDETQPGFDNSIIAPRIGGKLDWARCSYQSIHGEVAVHWKVKNIGSSHRKVQMKVRIPANTTATIQLLDGARLIYDDGLDFSEHEGIFQTQAPSGQYCIQFQLP